MLPMIFSSLRYFLCSAILLWITGCQYLPVDKAPTEQAEQETDQQTAVVNRAPNPYLLDISEVSSRVKQRFTTAKSAMQNKRWAEAETHLLWLTENHPELSGPWLNLALNYSAQQQPEKAEVAFAQAIASNPKNIYAYNRFAIFQRQAGKFNEAETLYKQALQHWPDYPDGHLNLAVLYELYMGKLELALQHYQTYQSLQGEPERQVAGWIIDLHRRIKSQSNPRQ